MRHLYRPELAPEIPRIALRPREAAIALGMSEKALWSLTTPRGPIPCIKHGTRTTYFVHQLQAYADEELARQKAAAHQQREAGQATTEGGSE